MRFRSSDAAPEAKRSGERYRKLRPGLAGELIVGNFGGGDAEESSHAEAFGMTLERQSNFRQSFIVSLTRPRDKHR